MKNDNKLEKEIRKVKIMIDRDGDAKYETHNWLVRIFRFPIMFILNLLPSKIGRAIFLAFSGPTGDTRVVFHSVATYKALEVMYTFPTRRAKGETTTSDFFWEYFLSNARAFRNRLLLVKRELQKAIEDVNKRKNAINLLSLGSGSARAVFETVNTHRVWSKIKIKLIDMSGKAIDYSQELARNFKLNQVEYIKDYAQNLEKYCNNFQPDIVEIVGLLDYYPFEQAVDLLAKIYKVLSPNGWLITGNVHPNFEQPFTTKSINWPVIYRSPQELATILMSAGFSANHLKIIYEPLKIHGVAIAQKVT